MTAVIDERVVEMRFNNEDFEKNVAQSMQTLDDLKKALKFEGGAKSLQELGNAAKNFSLTGITETISEATSKFSVMEVVGITAIAKITSSIMDMGTQLVKSLSVDQVTMGFDKYAEKTTAVQTIMAATEHQFSSQAEQMRVVEEQLEKLAWFTDETSYNFNDMVSNIGKFTSNKIGLEESVTAMQGIANWAARSGQNAQAASRAMYNISQAMGAGAMKQKDWMSIENANMATAEFKQTAIETAEELGRLKKVSDGLWTTLDGKGTVTIETFREELKRGWFDKEVMSATFAKYGEFTNVLNELYNATGKATSEILEDAEEFKKGNLNIEEYAKDTKMSVEELTEAFEALNTEGNELGKKAFGNAQEAKTFLEAIDATKDAVSTKWSQTFEIIFGNYLEAKKLWTGLANDLWQAFAAGGDERNEVLKAWKELGGRKELIMGAVNAANLLIKPLSTIKMALKDMFPDAESMSEVLYKMTVRFRELTEKLQPSNEMLSNIYRTFKGLFTLGKLVGQVIFALVKAVIPAARPFGSLLEMILKFTGYVGVFIEVIAEYAQEVGIFQAITEGAILVFSKLLAGIKTVATFVGGGLLMIAVTVASVFGKVVTAISKFLQKTQIIQKAINGITKVVDKFRSVFQKAEKPIEKVNTVIVKSEEYFSAAADSGAQFGTVINETGEQSKKALTPLQKVVNVIKMVASVLGLAVTAIVKLILTLGTKIKEFFVDLANRVKGADEDKNIFVAIFEALFDKVKEILGNAKDAIKEFFDNLGINTDGIKDAFDTISTAFGTFLDKMTGGRIVAILLSIALLAVIGEAIDLSQKIGTLAGSFNTFMKNINKILTKQFGSKLTMLKDISLAFTMIAGSLALLMYVDKDGTKIIKFAATMGALVTALTLLAYGIEKVSQKFLNVDFLSKSFAGVSATLLALSTSIVIVAGAMAILANIKGEDLKSLAIKLGIAVGGLAAVAGIAIALSKWTGPMAAGAATIIALGFALMQVAKAMWALAVVPIENINARWPEYITMFAGLSAMLAASSLLSIRSALGLILTAKGLEMIFPQITNLVNLAKELPVKAFVEAALENVQVATMFFIGATLAVIAAALIFERRKSVIGKLKGGGIFSGLGGALAGLGVGIFLITSSIEKLSVLAKELRGGNKLKDVAKSLGLIILAMGLFTSLIIAVNQFSKFKYPTDANTSFVKLGIMFVGLGVAVRLMASAVTAIAESTANGLELAGATAIITVLGVLLAAVVWVAGDVPKAIPAMAALIAAVVALGILIGELAVMTLLVDSFKGDWVPLITGFSMMVGLLAMLGLVTLALSKVKVGAGVVWGVAATIAAIGAVLVALALISSYNLPGLAVSLVGLMGILSVLGFVFTVLGEMDTPSIKKIISMVTIIGVIAAIGGALAIASKQNWKQIAAAGASMVIALGVIGGLLIILDKIGSQGGQLAAAGSILMVSLSLVAIAEALNVLKDIDTGEAAGKVAALLGIVSGLVLVFGLISAIPAIGEAFMIGMAVFGAALIMSAMAFTIFADAITPLAEGISLLTPALQKFAEIPFADIAIGLSEMGGGIAILGLAGIVLGFGAFGLTSGAYAIQQLGEAAGASVDNLNALATVDLYHIAGGLAALGAVGVGFGLFAPAVLSGAGALSVLGGSLYILKGGLDVVEGGFETFASGMESAGNSIGQTVDGIISHVSGLFPDLSSMFNGSEAQGVINDINDFGTKMAGLKHGGGFLGGLAAPLMWGCPVGVIGDLITDTGTEIQNNGTAVSAAEVSGSQIGNAFGSSIFKKAQGWLSSLGSNVSSWFNSIMSGDFTGLAVGTPLSTISNMFKNAGKSSDGFFGTVKNGFKELTNGDIVDKFKNKLKETSKEFDIGAKFENYFTEQTEEMARQVEEATAKTTDLGDAVGGAGGKAKGAAEDMKDFGSSLVDTLSGQLDMFSKFEIKMGISSDQMIENMKSNIDGFASWSHRMTVLAKRFADHGISDTLYKKLAELGPKGYETMNAFYEMSEEQLDEVKDLWATGLTLPQGQADIVASGYTYMGEMAVQGFSNALDEHDAAHAAAHGLGQAALDGLADALEVHSPSVKGYKIGQFLVIGIGQGITSEYSMKFTEVSINRITDTILELLNTNLSEDVMAEAGTGILTNLFNGLLGESIEENPIITTFIETFANFELIDEALTLFSEHVKELLYELFEIPGDEEPSEWFKRLVEISILQTVISTITEKTVDVITAVTTLCKAIIEAVTGLFGIEAGDEGFSKSETFYQIGVAAVLGLAEGLKDEDAVGQAVEAAVALATAVNNAVANTLEVNSPSKVMIRMGHSVGEGLTIGITDGAENVYSAAKQVAEGTIDAMSDMGRLQEALSTGIDYNPIITPMFDLSYIKSQMSELDSLMNDPVYGVNGQNEGKSKVTNVNYTQNNYSPKSLTRYEIYRQTQRQISSLKGAMG